MNHSRTPHKNTGLLVSVRSQEEALIAQATGCVSIVDLKEPANGALGCVSIDTANSIAASASDGTVLSIALGEAANSPVWPSYSLESRRATLAKFSFAKIGLAGLANSNDWIQQWKDSFAEVPETVTKVAVAYADSDQAKSPTVESVVRSAPEVGCSVLLIDTFRKSEGGLLDHLPIEQLTNVVTLARGHNLKIVLAGSLTHNEINIVNRLHPDFVAVRGAICRGNRSSLIDRTKIESLATLIRLRSPHSD